ncbi:MAG: hypothetical protein HN982_04420 [Candidatus Marinimicrobia bacterium]|nr:hypothetical protein [Bacteroidota bacterium]MBT6936812.1 hypothetical protein [Candidatus Neomarinimicrobiota bacterium]
MNKEKAQEHIENNLNNNDSLVGFFQAIEPPKIWLFFVIGPLAILSMKTYFVAATANGMHFFKLNLLGKFSDDDFFNFNEIENVKIGKGLLQRPFLFQFKNSRKLKIKAQLKGVDKIAKLTDETQNHIENNIPRIK